MELITFEINWEYLFFGLVVIAFVILYIVMWKRKKKLKDSENHDPWRDD
jgi:hypothetical protein